MDFIQECGRDNETEASQFCDKLKRNDLFLLQSRNQNSGIFFSRATKSPLAEGFDFYGREGRRAGFDDSRYERKMKKQNNLLKKIF